MIFGIRAVQIDHILRNGPRTWSMAIDPEKVESIANNFRFHVPLDCTGKQIRLLRPASRDDATEIYCTLTVAPLTATPLPQNEALSYCWETKARQGPSSFVTQDMRTDPLSSDSQ